MRKRTACRVITLISPLHKPVCSEEISKWFAVVAVTPGGSQLSPVGISASVVGIDEHAQVVGYP